MRHKAKDIDWADPGKGRKHTVLQGCYHLILFRGPLRPTGRLREWYDSKCRNQTEHLAKTSAIRWIKVMTL